MDFGNLEFVLTSLTIVILMSMKSISTHPCPTEVVRSPSVQPTTESTIQSLLFNDAGRAYTSFTLAFEKLEERLGLFEYHHFRPECTPEYSRLNNTYRLALIKDQPQDLFETHVNNLEFYVSLADWVIDNEDLYPGHRSLTPEFEAAYQHLLTVIKELDNFMIYNDFVNGTNITPTECEPTAPSPKEAIEFERYSRALVILADIRAILLSVMLDVSVCLSSSDVYSPHVTEIPTLPVT
ncbi:uncharacterized protein [Amphiura filiformis]|uniref:uncharacterized protein n=1 Tax=Amphiura filiformis TaxID=82378 RepID=UPI003B21609E